MKRREFIAGAVAGIALAPLSHILAAAPKVQSVDDFGREYQNNWVAPSVQFVSIDYYARRQWGEKNGCSTYTSQKNPIDSEIFDDFIRGYGDPTDVSVVEEQVRLLMFDRTREDYKGRYPRRIWSGPQVRDQFNQLHREAKALDVDLMSKDPRIGLLINRIFGTLYNWV